MFCVFHVITTLSAVPLMVYGFILFYSTRYIHKMLLGMIGYRVGCTVITYTIHRVRLPIEVVVS